MSSNGCLCLTPYFELGFEASELAAEFGYSLTRKVLNLQQFPGELDRLQELQERITEVLPYVPLTSELARREIIIARVVTELIHYTRAELRIEYPLKVSNQLQGNLNYLLRLDSPHTQLLVIEFMPHPLRVEWSSSSCLLSPISYLLVKSYKYTNEPGASKKSICLPILSR